MISLCLWGDGLCLVRCAMLAAVAVGLFVVPAHAGGVRDEFVRVAPDQWSFETSRTHQRFIPFGSNFVLTSKENLNIFGPTYDAKRYDKVLATCEGLHINLLKVFLPIGNVLPDPQVPGEARIAPGYIANLDSFLALCKKHSIRVVISLAEWGGNDCKWWHEGGQYFGRRPWKSEPGIDSIDVLCHFWTTLAGHLRDNPTVFSYTPCIEWTLPSSNMTWFPETVQHGQLPTQPGEWYWRRWTLAKYKTLDGLNSAWGTSYKSTDDISLADYTYDFDKHQYADPERKIADYQNFREWTTLRYFTPQIAAIRSADPNHMVTIANHMRQWNLWDGAAKYFMGFTAFEEKRLVDYVTHHANYDENDLQAGWQTSRLVHDTEIMLRFCHAGKPMPVILEEYSFTTLDPKRVAEVQESQVRGSIGHASGWTTWYLQYPDQPNTADPADKTHRSCWLNPDLTPTPWGEAAKRLYEELSKTDLSRKKPRRIVRLDRAKELVPKKLGAMLTVLDEYDKSPQPVDYAAKHEPDLDIKLPVDR